MTSPSTERDLTIAQNIVSAVGLSSHIRVKIVYEHFLNAAHVSELLATATECAHTSLPRSLGLAPISYTKKLDALAFSTPVQALVVLVDRTQKGVDASRLNLKGKTGKNKRRGRALLQNILLSRDISLLDSTVVIDAKTIAVALHTDLGLRIGRNTDVLALCSQDQSFQTPIGPLQDYLKRTKMRCDEQCLADLFNNREVSEDKVVTHGALRAWLALAIAASLPHCDADHELVKAKAIDTVESREEDLDILSHIVIKEQQKVSVSRNRRAPRRAQHPLVTMADKKLGSAVISSFYGDGSSKLHGLPFFRALYMGEVRDEGQWQGSPMLSPAPTDIFIPNKAGITSFNNAQRAFLERAVSQRDADRLIVVHGPPGTGKTTSIVTLCMASGPSRPTWVLTQSNKTLWCVTDRLLQSGFKKWKMLVNSHVVIPADRRQRLTPYIISTDDLPRERCDSLEAIDDAYTILSTLGTLSHPRLAAVKRLVPVQTVIVDEVGHIEINDFIPLLYSHAKTLARLILIGDEKQLPPYMQPKIERAQSIFDMPHLHSSRLNFDIQYRLPHVLGNFLCRRVYDGWLSTEHSVESWRACRFVDVSASLPTAHGKTAIVKGKMMRFHNEADAAISAACRYTQANMSFRILTKVACQREIIEKKLAEKGLPPSLSVSLDDFNVDEADHVICCPGRSWSANPEDERKAVVMISRCSVSMLICTNRKFLRDSLGKGILLAQLAEDCGHRGWIPWDDFVEEKWALEQGNI